MPDSKSALLDAEDGLPIHSNTPVPNLTAEARVMVQFFAPAGKNHLIVGNLLQPSAYGLLAAPDCHALSHRRVLQANRGQWLQDRPKTKGNVPERGIDRLPKTS